MQRPQVIAVCGEEQQEKEAVKNFCFECTDVVRKSAWDDVQLRVAEINELVLSPCLPEYKLQDPGPVS